MRRGCQKVRDSFCSVFRGGQTDLTDVTDVTDKQWPQIGKTALSEKGFFVTSVKSVKSVMSVTSVYPPVCRGGHVIASAVICFAWKFAGFFNPAS